MANSTISHPTVRIYLLRDPRDGAIRYVGKTVKALERRLRCHINSSKKPRLHSQRWIASLLHIGLRPVAEHIEDTAENWVEREKFWIAFHKAAGCNLTNISAGGDGSPGIGFTDEMRTNLADAVRSSWTPERRVAMSAWSIAQWTPERRAAQSERNLALGPAGYAAMHAALTPEVISSAARARALLNSDPAFIKILKASWTDERRTAVAKRTAARNSDPAFIENIKAMRTADMRSARAEITRALQTPERKTTVAAKVAAKWTPERRAKQAEVALKSAAKRLANNDVKRLVDPDFKIEWTPARRAAQDRTTKAA